MLLPFIFVLMQSKDETLIMSSFVNFGFGLAAYRAISGDDINFIGRFVNAFIKVVLCYSLSCGKLEDGKGRYYHPINDQLY